MPRGGYSKEECLYCGRELDSSGCRCAGFTAEVNSNRGNMENGQNGNDEYLPFMNGSDLPDDGVLVEILKVRTRKKGGFFIDVKADDGKDYTITANEVLVSMLLQLMVGQKQTLYPYFKGENVYISTRKQEQKPQQQRSGSGFRRQAQGQQQGGYARR